MLKKIESFEEKQLEDTLEKDISKLKSDLKLLERQAPAYGNLAIDLLAVDGEGTVTVIELKNQESDESLVQLLDYLFFATNNLDHIKNKYASKAKVNVQAGVYGILVAPSFSDRLKRAIAELKDAGETIELRRASYLQIDGKRDFLCELEPLPSAEVSIALTSDDVLNQIKSEKIRKIAEAACEKIRALDSNIKEKGTKYGSNFTYADRRVVKISPGSKCFYLELGAAGNYNYDTIRDKAAFASFFKKITKAYEALKQQYG
ncbi:MAG: hypothetical protein NTY90_00085 [Candidatus Micrarchaeota archaeon]|nr:hypothetical protein [Candidatus Micrarchaeota archaeon]